MPRHTGQRRDAGHPPDSRHASRHRAGAAGRCHALGARFLTDDSELCPIEAPIPDAPEDDARRRPLPRTLDAPAPDPAGEPLRSRGGEAMSSARTIDKVVLHITDGGANKISNGTIARFRNPQAQVSAHYVIGREARRCRWCAYSKAWHASSANTASIIEHVANTRGLIPDRGAVAHRQRWSRGCAISSAFRPTASTLGALRGRPPHEPHRLPQRRLERVLLHADDRHTLVHRAARCTSHSPPARATQRGRKGAAALARAQEIIMLFDDPANPASALTCQNDAFSQAREEWLLRADAWMFPHSAIVKLTMAAPNGDMYGGTDWPLPHSLRARQPARHVAGDEKSQRRWRHSVLERNGAEFGLAHCPRPQRRWRLAARLARSTPRRSRR